MKRTAHRVLADRRRTNRAAAKLRRRGVATAAGHCIAAGLRPRTPGPWRRACAATR
ncbi:hypothetical protein ACFQ60_15210 [Streptomyces zhihengii]